MIIDHLMNVLIVHDLRVGERKEFEQVINKLNISQGLIEDSSNSNKDFPLTVFGDFFDDFDFLLQLSLLVFVNLCGRFLVFEIDHHH